jgi:hypothetical protein
MNRAAVVMMIVVAALVGASVALVVGVAYEHHIRLGLRGGWMHRDEGFRPYAGGRPPLEQVLPRLARSLDLSPEQIARIKPKVVESQRQFEAARESLRNRIIAELTPEQRRRWQEMERTHELMRPFRGRPGDEHPDRPEAGNPGDPR